MVIAPRGLTLPIGGQGQLNATANDAAGAAMTGVTIGWTTQSPSIASVSTTGVVSGNAAGQTTAIASAQGKADTVNILVVNNFTLEVTPPAATADIGKTAQFAVVARDGSGNVIATPPVAWTSGSPAIGTVSNTGLTTGISVGTTAITATAGRVASLPALFSVRDTASAAAACDGIAGATEFKAIIDYGFKAVKVADGAGFVVDADDNGHLVATMTRFSGGPLVAAWTGVNTGNASITQSSSSTAGVASLTGGGAMIPLPGAGLPKVSFFVNLQTCTFRLVSGATLNVKHTSESGSVLFLDEIVSYVQFAGPLGAWRFGVLDFGSGLAVHPVAWAGLHLDTSALSPLGYAAGWEGLGQGTGGFSVTFVR